MVAADLHGRRSPTGTEPSHGDVGARKATLFSGIDTHQDSTTGLVTGAHDLATKTPAQARVEHGSAATAFVLTKIDTLHGYHPADGSDRGAPHRRTAPTEQRRANPPAPPNQCLESLLPALRRAASRAYISSTISVNLFSTSRRRTLRVGVSSPLSVVNSSHNTRRSRICS